ncbi:MAG: LamG domain-containing protein [Pyrinomonadaceae bacterium]
MFTKMMKIYTAVFLLILGCASLAHAQDGVLIPVCTPAPVGLQAWYAADGNALDSRSRNNGTLQNGATFAAGEVGQAFSFDGTGGVIVPDNPSLNFGANANLSIDAWIKTSDTSRVTKTIVDKRIVTGGTRGYVVFLVENGLVFQLADGTSTNYALGSNLTDGMWHHIAITVDRASTTGGNAYVDGVQTATFNPTDHPGDLTNNGAFLIGQHVNIPSANFIGQIDETEVFDRAISAQEVANIFNAGTAGKCKPTATVSPDNQVLWLAGDGDTRDFSGSGNNGTLQNGANFAVGKVGQGFNFTSNGNNSEDVKVNASASLNVGTGGGLTIETWMRPTDTSRAQVFAEWNNGSNIGVNCAINSVVGGSTNGNILINFTDTNGANHIVQTAQGLLTANVYQHIAASYDKTTGIGSIYLNGALVASQNLGVFTPQTAYDFYLGRRITTGGILNFNGQLDETSVYNRALSADEISSIVNAGLAGKLKQTTTATTTATIGSATVTFSNATARTAQQIPLDPALFPALPMGANTGLDFDVAADVPDSSPTVCFNLPSFTTAQFPNLRIYHFESGAWQNRTGSSNSMTSTLCTMGLTSLSPFAIGLNAPTAASVSIGGRVLTAIGRGIRNVRVSLTDASGETRYAMTNPFGYYRFEDVESGATYILSVSAKRYRFENPTRILSVNEEIENLDFTASPKYDLTFAL